MCVIVHCVSADLQVENGIAKEISNKYGGTSSLKRHKKKVGTCLVRQNRCTLFYLITKKHYTDAPSYIHFEQCLLSLKEKCQEYKIKTLAFPKYGAGLDKLDWNKVKLLINRILINNQIHCVIYTNAPKTLAEKNEENLNINEKLKRLQKQDAKIRKLIDSINKNKSKGFVIENEIVLKLRKAKNKRIFRQLVVPDVLKNDILKLCHDNFTGAHLGEQKTWVKLNNRFYWENSFAETINYVKSCPVCAKIKNPPANRAHLAPITDFKKPFDKVAVDILELSQTNTGNKYVVVFTDYLTKWVEAFPLRNMTAESVAKVFINEIITRHSAPSELLSDQGANFMSKLIKAICNYFKINKINTAPYNPKCDGLVERFNRTLCQMLASYSNANQTNWDLYLPLVLFAYRTSAQATTGESPFNLLYGREPRLPCNYDNFNHYNPSNFIENLHFGWLEAKRQIEKQGRTSQIHYDGKYQNKPPEYKEGELIRLKQPLTTAGLKIS